MQLIFYWESQAAVVENYDVFVHLLDESGEIVAQSDRKPVDGLVATDVWQPGDIIRDPVLIPLLPDLQAGSYGLQMGVYLRESGERLPVHGGSASNNALLLESVIVP